MTHLDIGDWCDTDILVILHASAPWTRRKAPMRCVPLDFCVTPQTDLFLFFPALYTHCTCPVMPGVAVRRREKVVGAASCWSHRAQPGLTCAQAVGGRRSRRCPFPHHSLATREAEDDAGGHERSTGRGDLGQTPGEGAAGSGCSLGDFRPSTCRWIGRRSVGAVVPASHSLPIRVAGPSCWSAAGWITR
jgi:hypothetical protein